MIEIYRPDSLIVGTRGRPDSLFKMGAFMGSISKYVFPLLVSTIVLRDTPFQPLQRATNALSRRYCVAKSPVPVVRHLASSLCTPRRR
jgi:hypothetical protein